MKNLVLVVLAAITLAGCVVVPAYYGPPRAVRIYPAPPPPVYYRYHYYRY
ncbi:MAG TPA: hypothetical protein VLT92_14785 [Burkholderiales bacterium]|nr:hypothetical protein [Burkholderiales bacterium]